MANMLGNTMFKNLVQPRDVTKYTLMRGTTDFPNVAMWNNFETGYSYMTVVQVPRYLELLAAQDETYARLINNYVHILEYEFKGLDGIEDITTETGRITNGISEMEFVNKVIVQDSTNFTMRYTEKSGSVLTRVNELFLTGIKDGRTQIKRYHGLLDNGTITEPGYEYETFSFMYFVTDNTMMNLEKAYYIVNAQPIKAETSMYNSEKGDINFKEIGVEFTGFPITSSIIDQKADAMLKWLNDPSNPNKIVADSNNFLYTGVSDINTKF